MSPHSSTERVSLRGGSKTGPGRRRKLSLVLGQQKKNSARNTTCIGARLICQLVIHSCVIFVIFFPRAWSGTKSSGNRNGREISLFQTDKQRLALNYTVILLIYSQCESLCSNWLAVNTARWTTNCTFYHLSIFFTTDFKLLWQVGGASRI